MCNFCKKIYPLSEGGFPEESLIAHDEPLDQFDIWACNPYDCVIIQDVKYCPYCGRNLKGENNEP